MTETKIDLFDAIYTQRAIRSFKTDPVPDDVIRMLIGAASKAPSAGNTQPWAFVVVRSPQTIAAIGGYARKAFEVMYQRALSRAQPGDEPPYPRLKPMVENFEAIPAIIFPCLVKADPAGPPQYSSIFPAVQNLLLAARGLGLGAVITAGIAMPYISEIKELLNIPADVEPVALIPIGWPDKERYGRTTRKPVDQITHWEAWGNLQQA